MWFILNVTGRGGAYTGCHWKGWGLHKVSLEGGRGLRNVNKGRGLHKVSLEVGGACIMSLGGAGLTHNVTGSGRGLQKDELKGVNMKGVWIGGGLL